MNIYAENILDHFRHPRYYEPLLDFMVDHEEWNHACGDSIHVWLELKNGTIAKIGWTGGGCVISQASMSMLSEELEGMKEEDMLKLTKENVYALLGVPIGPRRFKCALMSLHTVKNALHKAAGKPLQSWTETVALEKEE